MDRVDDLTAIVQHEVADYANVRDWKATSYYIGDEKQQRYTVVVIPEEDHPLVSHTGVIVMARIVGNKVIIDEDITDKPLYEELIQRGIPREQIVLAYAGEKLPVEPEEH
jgi:hypothetical protein